MQLVPRFAAFAVMSIDGCDCSGKPIEMPCKFDIDCPGTGDMKCDPTKKVCVKRTICPDTPCGNAETCLNTRCYQNDCCSTNCADDQVCSGGK